MTIQQTSLDSFWQQMKELQISSEEESISSGEDIVDSERTIFPNSPLKDSSGVLELTDQCLQSDNITLFDRYIPIITSSSQEEVIALIDAICSYVEEKNWIPEDQKAKDFFYNKLAEVVHSNCIYFRPNHYIQGSIIHQKFLLALVKIIAVDHPLELAQKFPRYNLLFVEDRAHLAMYMAGNDGASISCYIKNFFLFTEDQKYLIDVALIALRNNFEQTIKQFDNYQIRSQEAKFQIAKAAALEDGGLCSYYIDRLQLDKKYHVEIAKIAAKNSGVETVQYIAKYELDREEDFFAVFIEALSDGDVAVLEHIDTTHFSTTTFFTQIKALWRQLREASLTQDKNKMSLFIEELSRYTRTRWPFWKRYSEIYELMIYSPSIEDQIALGLWMSWTLAFFKGKIDEVFLDRLVIVAKYNNKKMRYSLTRALFSMAYESDIENNFFYKTQVVNGVKHTELPSFFLSKLHIAGVSQELLEKFFLAIKNDRTLRDSVVHRILLKNLAYLSCDSFLIQEDIEYILPLILVDGACDYSRMMAIKGIAQCNPRKLERHIIKNNNNNFDKVFFDAFSEIVPIADIENFTEKYENSFQKNLRIPLALFLYASSLQAMSPVIRKIMMPIFSRYIRSVLDGTFYNERYSLDNQQLQRLFKEYPTVAEEWKRGESMPISAFSVNPTKSRFVVVQTIQLFFKKNPGVAREYPDLWLYLQSKQDERWIYLTTILNKIKEKMDKNEDDTFEARRLDIQKNIILLCEDNEPIPRLIRLRDKVVQYDPTTRLLSLIDRLLIYVHQKDIHKYAGCIVVDTDNPYDLLLSGTEVRDSCFHVAFSTSNSVGLLSCLMDGKIRMIAVTKPSGEILARAFFILYLDATTKKYVVFLGQVYGQSEDLLLQEIIKSMALRRASALNMSLVQNAVNESSPTYPRSVIALPSPVPYEWVDALQKHIEEVEYTIPAVDYTTSEDVRLVV